MRVNKHYYSEANPDASGAGGHGGNAAPIVGDPGAGGEGDPGAAPASWPDNWREMYAGEDTGKIAQLSRYASPSAAFDGLIATKQKISSGEYKSSAAFPTEGSDEEKSVWRTDNGIPSGSDGYEYTKTFADDDKEFVDGFSKYAHENNIPTSHADKFMSYLLEIEEKGSEEDKVNIDAFSKAAEDSLRVEWGNSDYRRNMNVIDGFMKSAPDEVREALSNSVMPNGMPLIKDANMLKWMAGQALASNPMPSLVYSGSDPTKGAQDIISKAEKMMREDSKAYYKDEAFQAQYRDALEFTENQKKAN